LKKQTAKDIKLAEHKQFVYELNQIRNADQAARARKKAKNGGGK
jgi:hypothetical protein